MTAVRPARPVSIVVRNTGSAPRSAAITTWCLIMDDNFIISDTPGPCWHCAAPTFYVEISFEAHLCPGACADAKWEDYRIALNACLLKEKVSKIMGRPLHELSDTSSAWATGFIDTFAKYMLSEPGVVMNYYTGVNFEWHRNGYDLEIDSHRFYLLRPEHEIEGGLDDDRLPAFIKMVSA